MATLRDKEKGREGERKIGERRKEGERKREGASGGGEREREREREREMILKLFGEIQENFKRKREV